MIKVLLLILILSTNLLSRPLYELGLGYVGFYSPHYPGSDQTEFRSALLPLVVYRGETIYADEEGIKSDISKRDWYNLELSVVAAFPANSNDNRAREGMQDLDWLAEFGPSFAIHLYKSTNEFLDLRLQARAVYSTDFADITYRGYVSHVMFYYEKSNFVKRGVTLFLRAGSVYGSERIMDYFYEVKQKDVRADRPKYDAKPGYLESHFDLGFLYDPGSRLRYYLGFQRNFYNNTENQDSPLHRANEAFSVGVGLTWTMFKSEAQEKTN